MPVKKIAETLTFTFFSLSGVPKGDTVESNPSSRVKVQPLSISWAYLLSPEDSAY